MHVHFFVCMAKRWMVTDRYVLGTGTCDWYILCHQSLVALSPVDGECVSRSTSANPVGVQMLRHTFSKFKKCTGTDIATAALETLTGWATHKTFANWQSKKLS